MASVYFDSLKDLPIDLPIKGEDNDSHAWHLFPIKIKPESKIDRSEFIELMAKQGIGCSVHYIPLHLHPYWRDTYKLTPAMFPNAQMIYEQEVSLPLYTKMTDSDQQKVIKSVKLLLDD